MARVRWLHLEVSLAQAVRNDELDLDPEATHHLGTVLRARIGAELVVADGRGRWASAELIAADRVRLVDDVVHQPPLRPRLHLVQALAKGRKLDQVVRVATELGVDAITPMWTSRSPVHLEGVRAERAGTRWRAVARSACEQAGRAWRPEVAPITKLGPELPPVLCPSTAADRSRVVLVALPGAPALPEQLEQVSAAVEVVIAIGPEGGFAPGERHRLETCGVRPVGLGPTLLRTEHAGAAALAVVSAVLGRWSQTPPYADER